MKRIVFSIVLINFFVLSAFAMTPYEIMEETIRVARESSKTSIQKMKLSTCKYGIKKKRMVCVEKPRVKVIESVQKDTGPDDKDSKAVSIILEPASEKGVGMLSYDYDDLDRDNDNWLYLSALGKVKRIVSSSDDDDTESGSFFGSEFAIEDMETQKVEDYTYKLLKEGVYTKRKVWVIESRPTPKRARKTRYSKSVTWIDKERFIELKVDLYDKHGRLKKRLTMRKIKLIDGVWTARSMTMNNLSSRRVTQTSLTAIAFNHEVSDKFLTQRTLTDFAFRERELNKLRKYIK